MYHILICDDDASYIRELETMILECNKSEREIVFHEFSSGEELLEKMPPSSDAVFLDIQMQGEDGNQIAVKLNKMGYGGLLIQCSGIYMPTPETIKISPYRFLLKQDSAEVTQNVIREILAELDVQKACAVLEGFCKREKVLVKTKDIAYITKGKRGSVLHLAEGENVLVQKGFDEMMELLQSSDFVIPHSSYIINLRYVTGVDFIEGIVSIGSETFNIVRTKKKEMMEAFASYMNRKYKETLR